AQQELARRLERLAVERPAPGLRQDHGGLPRELRGRRAVELGLQPRRLVEVERADLEQLVARALVEPLRKARVILGAGRLGPPGIGDLADQDVLEPVRGLAGDRRAALADDEVAQE